MDNKRLYNNIINNIAIGLKKTLNEDILKFDVASYEDDSLVDKETLDDVLQIPKTKNELIDILEKRIKENKFGNSDLCFPDLSDIDTSKITDMSDLFYGIGKRVNMEIRLDLSNWNTSNVLDMSNMFLNCIFLTEINLSGLDTSNVEDMRYMFNECTYLTKLDLSGFNTSNVKSMRGMFANCETLTELDLSNFDMHNVTDISAMFWQCFQLTKLNLSDWDICNVSNMSFMFWECRSLSYLDTTGWDTFKVTHMSHMFHECDMLKILPNWYKNSLKENTLNFDITDYTDDKDDILGQQEIYDIITLHPKNKYELKTIIWKRFEEALSNAKNKQVTISPDMTNIDTSQITDMSSLFQEVWSIYNITNPVILDLSSWDTKNVTTMERMFQDCRTLKSVDVSNFDTSSILSLALMFCDCRMLTELDLSSFDTSNVKERGEGVYFSMFCFCINLKKLDISNLNANLQRYNYATMFYDCDPNIIPPRFQAKL